MALCRGLPAKTRGAKTNLGGGDRGRFLPSEGRGGRPRAVVGSAQWKGHGLRVGSMDGYHGTQDCL